jgi:hypothetical protein
MPALDRGGLPGLIRAQSFEADGDWARAYRVDPAGVGASVDDVALHLSPAAALAWLDLQGSTLGSGGGDAGARALVEVSAVVIGSNRDALANRLAGLACFAGAADDGPDAARIVPVGRDCEAWRVRSDGSPAVAARGRLDGLGYHEAHTAAPLHRT